MKISKRQLVSSFGLFAVGLMVTVMCAGSANAQSDTNALRAWVQGYSNGGVGVPLAAGEKRRIMGFGVVPATLTVKTRFVIERVTGQIIMSGDQALESVALITNVDPVPYPGVGACDAHYLSIPTVISSRDGQNKTDVYNFDLTRRFYADSSHLHFCGTGLSSGDLFLDVVRIDGSKATQFTVRFTASGYLVDLTGPVPPPVSSVFPALPKPAQSLTSLVRTAASAEPKIDWLRDTDFNITGSSTRATFLFDNSMH